jgi:hypothetical protein
MASAGCGLGGHRRFDSSLGNDPGSCFGGGCLGARSLGSGGRIFGLRFGLLGTCWTTPAWLLGRGGHVARVHAEQRAADSSDAAVPTVTDSATQAKPLTVSRSSSRTSMLACLLSPLALTIWVIALPVMSFAPVPASPSLAQLGVHRGRSAEHAGLDQGADAVVVGDRHPARDDGADAATLAGSSVARTAARSANFMFGFMLNSLKR